MNCYVHAQAGEAVPAVMVCKNCGAGMCLEHVVSLQHNRPGGMELGCNHVVPAPSVGVTPAQQKHL